MFPAAEFSPGNSLGGDSPIRTVGARNDSNGSATTGASGVAKIAVSVSEFDSCSQYRQCGLASGAGVAQIASGEVCRASDTPFPTTSIVQQPATNGIHGLTTTLRYIINLERYGTADSLVELPQSGLSEEPESGHYGFATTAANIR